MTDVFTVLARDHQEVKDMLAELEKGLAKGTGAGDDQLALRKKMTEQLIIEESTHEALEEMYFWPAVREHFAAGNTLADTATGQEQDAKQVLAELDKLQAGDLEFEKLLGTFIVDAREHIAFEETQVWPSLRRPFPATSRPNSAPRSRRARRPRPRGRIRTRPLRPACSRWPRRSRRPRTRCGIRSRDGTATDTG